jgi:hypothetical protein
MCSQPIQSNFSTTRAVLLACLSEALAILENDEDLAQLKDSTHTYVMENNIAGSGLRSTTFRPFPLLPLASSDCASHGKRL